MNLNNFTIKSQEAIEKATEIAAAKQNQSIEPLHLLKGILMVDENVVPFLLRKLGVNFDAFLRSLIKKLILYQKLLGENSIFPQILIKPFIRLKR